VVRIRDTNTGAVISESPTPEVQAMLQALKAYADTAARHAVQQHVPRALKTLDVPTVAESFDRFIRQILHRAFLIQRACQKR
jgi:hypothetical protein